MFQKGIIMTIEEAIEIVKLHNQWRKGADIPMENPTRLGMALDLVVHELEDLYKKQNNLLGIKLDIIENYTKDRISILGSQIDKFPDADNDILLGRLQEVKEINILIFKQLGSTLISD